MKLSSLINDTICCFDTDGKLKARDNPYSCVMCKKEFEHNDFGVLPSLSGYLCCEQCYQENEDTLLSKPYTGGYVLYLIGAEGMGYGFSHGGCMTTRAVCFNRHDGFFLVKHEFSCGGCGYYVLKLPKDFDVYDKEKVLSYESEHGYEEDMNYDMFHPFLFFPNYFDVKNQDSEIMKRSDDRKESLRKTGLV
ncbi:MAG: hypothetical protein IKB73_04355 [Ruminococcus sp.]|nr:hypothetical protein [Ruminococcus sp.]